MKQEFVVNEVKVQLFTDRDSLEVHVMGKTQDTREDGFFWLSVSLNGETEEYVSPLTGDTEDAFFVYAAVASAIFGWSYYAFLAKAGHYIPDTLEFNRLYAGIQNAEREIWEAGVILPFDPTHESLVWIPQLFAMAPILGAPEVTYAPNGAVTRVDFGSYGFASLMGDSVEWDEDGEINVAYWWRRKK